MRESAMLLLVVAFGCVGPGLAGGRPGQPFDLQGFVSKRVADGARRIVIPPGRYRVTPRHAEHLRLEGVRDVEIVADGVEMVCTETTRAVTIEKCSKLTLRGLAIDYDPLPYTQGRIAALSDDRLVHEIELFEGYPESGQIAGSKYEIFRADARTLRYGSYYDYKVEALKPRRIRITKAARYRGEQWHLEQVGDIIAIATSHAPGGSQPHAVYLHDCADVTLEDVRLYASNCFGFLEVSSDHTTYRRCRVDRRTEDDIRLRGDARIRSLNADAFHSKCAVRGPSYIECSAAFQGDDCIAINGDYHLIASSEGKALRVLAKGHGMNVQPGDPVELVSYTGERLPDAVAVAVTPDGRIREAERAFLLKQHMDRNLKTRGLGKAFRVTLDRAVDLPRGSVICSANRIGNGFKIVGCTLGWNRSRGVIVKASQGEIRDNRIEGCWMEAVKLAPEWWWLEAGSGGDIVVSGNVIRNTQSIAIAAHAHGGNGKLAPAGAHRNITIIDNRIKQCPVPAILVTSTAGVACRNNVLALDPARTPEPWVLHRFGIRKPKPILFIHCTGVTEEGNQLR